MQPGKSHRGGPSKVLLTGTAPSADVKNIQVSATPSTAQSSVNPRDSLDLATSNLTTNHFLGVTQRPWMILDTGTGHGAVQTLTSSSQVPLQNLQSSAQLEAAALSSSSTVQVNCGILPLRPSSPVSVVTRSAVPNAPEKHVSPTYRFVPVSSGVIAESSTKDQPQSRDANIAPHRNVVQIIDLTAPTQWPEFLLDSTSDTTTRSTPGTTIVPAGPSTTGLPGPTPTPGVSATQSATPTTSALGSIDHQEIPSSEHTPAPGAYGQGQPYRNPFASTRTSVAQELISRPSRPNQLLTPAASPEQFVHYLQRKRPLDQSMAPVDVPDSHLMIYGPEQRRTTNKYRPGLAAPIVPVLRSKPNTNPVSRPSRQTSITVADRLDDQQGHVLQSPRQSYLDSFNSVLQDMVVRSPENLTPHVAWIREACAIGDLSYLFLNQLLCSWCIGKNAWTSPAMDDFTSSGLGFKVLRKIFNLDYAYSNELLSFLTGWPFSPSLFKSSPQLVAWTPQIVLALRALGEFWDTFCHIWISRHYPPSAVEIAKTFYCHFSPTFSRVIFSLVTYMSRPEAPDDFRSAANELFLRDQNKFHANQHSLLSSDLLAGQSINAFQYSYHNLCLQYPVLNSRPGQEIPNPTLTRGSVLRAQPTNSASTSKLSVNMSALPRTLSVNPQNLTFVSDTRHSKLHTPPVAIDISQSMRKFMPKSSSLLLPIVGAPPPPLLADPDYRHEALHQAHLQQPLTVIKDITTCKPYRLYQLVEDCALTPFALSVDESFFCKEFEIKQDIIARKAALTVPLDESMPWRTLDTNSVILSLRCAQIDESSIGTVTDSMWAVLSTSWPKHIFISVNGHHTEIRRKQQHLRDMPIDVTEFVHEGRNEIVISTHGSLAAKGVFAIACEIIAFRDQAQVVDVVQQLSARDSLYRILQTMRADTADDDDIQMVSDSIILSVTDPLSLCIYDTPVRGKDCLHHECFSLETFLQSRASDNNDELTSVRLWLCPHCKKDARPQSLVVDGFMKEVRDEIVRSGNLEAKAIVLKDDGSWAVKPNEELDHTGLHTDGIDENQVATTAERTVSNVAQNMAVQTPNRDSVIDIIDLEDD